LVSSSTKVRRLPGRRTARHGKALMIKVALVSSYGIECGIASYVAHLEPALRRGNIDLDIYPLPVKILRSTTRGGRSKAALWMDSLCRELKAYDVVNLQLEPGMFGFFPSAQLRRITRIIRAAQALVVTLHTFPPPSESSFSGLLNSPRAFLHSYLQRSVQERFYRRLSRRLRTSGKKSVYIVHNRRERHTLELEDVDSACIVDHPLAYFPSGFASESAQRVARAWLVQQYNMDPGDYLIGTFGFIAPYKGTLTAIRALNFLPEQYKLMIFGNVHSMAQDVGQAVDPHLASVLAELKAKKSKLHRRVRFCGTLGDGDFTQAIMGCDSVTLPYLEVGQSGSGPASMALELARHVALSRSKCFLELKRYAGDAFDMFDIGNDLELAQLLETKPHREKRTAALAAYRASFHLDSNASKYLEAFARVAAP
jgi:glycosyltransferase involved in cell wall biosynthesis